MGSIDKKVEFCPLRHPSLNGKENICFYSSERCNCFNTEKCEVYNQFGRTYSLKVQEYQNIRQGENKKE